MANKTKAIVQLICWAFVLVSGAGALPGGDRDPGPGSSEDLIAVVKVGKTYYSNEPLTEDGRGVLYPVPDRLLGVLGLPKPTDKGAGYSGRPGGGYTVAEEMKLSVSETRRPAAQPRPTFTTTKQPDRGYLYKKPDIPFRYPDEFQAEQEPERDSNELQLDEFLRDRGQSGEPTSSTFAPERRQPNLNQQDIRTGTNSKPSYVAKDIPTFDSILKGAGVEDDLREGDEFTGFQSPKPQQSQSKDSKVGTQSQFFNAGIRDILYQRGGGRNSNGNGERGPAPPAKNEFDQLALFVPSNQVRDASPSSTSTTESELDEPSTGTTIRNGYTTRRTTTSTRASSTTTEAEQALLDLDADLASLDAEEDMEVGENDLSLRGKGKDQGYGARKPRPRTRTATATATARSRPRARTTEEPVKFEVVREQVVPEDEDNELESLDRDQHERPTAVRVETDAPDSRIVTTITHLPPPPQQQQQAQVLSNAGEHPSVHHAPTIDLSAQVLPNNMNQIMNQIYAPIQQQLPFIPMFDSIQPATYLPFMQQPHLQPMQLLQMHAPIMEPHPGVAHAAALREALYARAQELSAPRPAPIQAVYERGNGDMVYGGHSDLLAAAPLSALSGRDYDFSGQAIDASIRAEAVLPRPHKHHYGKSHYPGTEYSPRERHGYSLGLEQDTIARGAPKMEMFTVADAMTRRPPLHSHGAPETLRTSTTERSYTHLLDYTK